MSSEPVPTRTSTILGAATALIEERGPTLWTMEDVASRAHVTRMTVYRYFPSRSALLVAAVRHVDEMLDVGGKFAEVAESRSGIEALEAWVRVWSDYLPRIYPLARALLAARHSDSDAAEAWADRMDSLRGGCERIVRWLEHDGVLAHHLSVAAATDLMWAIVSVQVWEALTEDRGWTTTQYQAIVVASLVGALVDEAKGDRLSV